MAQVTVLEPIVLPDAPVQVLQPVYGEVETIIRNVANKYGISEDYFVDVAICETTTLNPSAVNYNYWAGGGHPTGLFQFLPETWDRMSRMSGIYGDIWNAQDNAELAGWAFANGHSGEWACK